MPAVFEAIPRIECACPKHPYYKAVRQPKGDCLECLRLWFARRLHTRFLEVFNE